MPIFIVMQVVKAAGELVSERDILGKQSLIQRDP
jgi:hypothetical protein